MTLRGSGRIAFAPCSFRAEYLPPKPHGKVFSGFSHAESATLFSPPEGPLAPAFRLKTGRPRRLQGAPHRRAQAVPFHSAHWAGSVGEDVLVVGHRIPTPHPAGAVCRRPTGASGAPSRIRGSGLRRSNWNGSSRRSRRRNRPPSGASAGRGSGSSCPWTSSSTGAATSRCAARWGRARSSPSCCRPAARIAGPRRRLRRRRSRESPCSSRAHPGGAGSRRFP